MASGWTNRGKYLLLGHEFRGETLPTNFYVYLVNSTPDADDNTYADITEASNYDGEQSLSRNATDFDTWTEDDGASDEAYIQIKDLVFTASGGTCTCTHAILTDDNGTEANRQIIAFWDLGATQNIPDGDTLTLQNLQLTLSNA